MSYKPKNTHERILHRLKIARGQLDGLIKMSERDKYWIDIIGQSEAVQAALKQVDILITENYIKKSGMIKFLKKKDQATVSKEIMLVFRKINNKKPNSTN